LNSVDNDQSTLDSYSKGSFVHFVCFFYSRGYVSGHRQNKTGAEDESKEARVLILTGKGTSEGLLNKFFI
jgi:hypothetical protein